jgi:uncharacterized coiled-coil protein SlyX
VTYLDVIVTLLILAAVLWSAHRLGQANPVGTGRLARRMDQLELKVAEQGEKMAGVEQAVLLLSQTSSETATAIQALRLETASDRGTTERTWEAVDRLQHFFIEEAFKRRAER